MKRKILILSCWLTCINMVLAEDKAESIVHENHRQKQIIVSSSPSKQTMPEKSTELVINIKMSGIGHIRPPLHRYLVDVELKNNYNQPYWFLIQSEIIPDTPREAIGEFPIYNVQAYTFTGETGYIIVSDFNAESGRFYGFLIPAKGNIKLRELPIEIWINKISELKKIELEVVIASKIKVNNQPSEAWVKTNPMSDAQTEADFNYKGFMGYISMPNFDNVPISINEKERFIILTKGWYYSE